MRTMFSELLYQNMEKDDRIYILMADLGYKTWERFEERFPNRTIRLGASEQLMLGIATGLALDGKIPVVHAITPFLICRPYEWIRNYVNHQNLPIKLAASGRDKDYLDSGFTHWGVDDMELLSPFKNITIMKPTDKLGLASSMHEFLYSKSPCYMNLTRIPYYTKIVEKGN